jgi:hypothetical protein
LLYTPASPDPDPPDPDPWDDDIRGELLPPPPEESDDRPYFGRGTPPSAAPVVVVVIGLRANGIHPGDAPADVEAAADDEAGMVGLLPLPLPLPPTPPPPPRGRKGGLSMLRTLVMVGGFLLFSLPTTLLPIIASTSSKRCRFDTSRGAGIKNRGSGFGDKTGDYF